MTKRFAMIGAAGYVAPKHMKAIKDVGGELVFAHDVRDSVGILDSYFPDCWFTTSGPKFSKWIERNDIDYFVVCTPNHQHLRHCYLGMIKADADVICEKPIVLHSSDLNLLRDAAGNTGHKVHPILQLRYTTELNPPSEGRETIFVRYYTPRGYWYHESWKGQEHLSGGLATNIGIHIFDWLLMYWGPMESFTIKCASKTDVLVDLELENADVSVQLSVDKKYKPLREVWIGEERYELSSKFYDLHTHSYKEIMEGRGFTIEDCRPSIELVEGIRDVIQLDKLKGN